MKTRVLLLVMLGAVTACQQIADCIGDAIGASLRRAATAGGWETFKDHQRPDEFTPTGDDAGVKWVMSGAYSDGRMVIVFEMPPVSAQLPFTTEIGDSCDNLGEEAFLQRDDGGIIVYAKLTVRDAGSGKLAFDITNATGLADGGSPLPDRTFTP